MRRVKFFKYDKSPPVLVCKGEANFHQWGLDFEEFETGAGNYSTAIIELDNGVVENIPAEHIEFIGKQTKKNHGISCQKKNNCEDYMPDI